MKWTLLGCGIALMVAGAWLLWRLWRLWREQQSDALSHYTRRELSVMPAELAHAVIWHSEKLTRVILGGRYWRVRPDQLFRTTDGTIIPVETKTRRMPRAFPYDAIELGMARLAAAQAGQRVASYGYVRVSRQNGQRPVYLKVVLPDAAAMESLVARFDQIRGGTIQPRHQSNPKACAACSYRHVCPHQLARESRPNATWI